MGPIAFRNSLRQGRLARLTRTIEQNDWRIRQGLLDRVFDIAAMDVNGIVMAVNQSCDQREHLSAHMAKKVAGFRAKLMGVLNGVLP